MVEYWPRTDLSAPLFRIAIPAIKILRCRFIWCVNVKSRYHAHWCTKQTHKPKIICFHLTFVHRTADQPGVVFLVVRIVDQFGESAANLEFNNAACIVMVCDISNVLLYATTLGTVQIRNLKYRIHRSNCFMCNCMLQHNTTKL